MTSNLNFIEAEVIKRRVTGSNDVNKLYCLISIASHLNIILYEEDYLVIDKYCAHFQAGNSFNF